MSSYLHKNRSFLIRISLITALGIVFTLTLPAQKLSKKHKGGYVVSWNDDTTEVYIKAKDGCELSYKVEALKTDTRDKVIFYPANIKAFGYDGIDWRLVKMQNTILKEVDPVNRNMIDPESIKSLEFAQ